MEAKIVARGPQVILVQREDWRASYDAELQKLESAAGTCLLAFEHVGSTAIPGLASKPVIDILAAAATLNDPAIAESMNKLGYIQIPFVPPSKDANSQDVQRLFFLKRGTDTPEGVAPSQPGYNVHVVPMARFRDDVQLVFRDHLRRHPDLVAEYAGLKCEIVGRIASYSEYMPAKTAFIERVLTAAREES
jgi:GrpB-like predicted nucleotidyltransferase (UPF0157 family)